MHNQHNIIDASDAETNTNIDTNNNDDNVDA